MLLKPATPLTVLLLAAFVLLLLSTLSTPVIKGIPLATFQNVDLGVFGYCRGSQCSKVRVGYSTDHLFETEVTNADFNLPSSARNSLSSILIVHPVAAFLTLVCLIMAAASHFRSPSHSPRYLLALLILLLPTVLVSLLAFLVDILLFVPHLSWGGWIVLAATIIIVACGVVTCAMRRTLVSRKARKRRIAENAEMNGQNFYSRQNSEAAMLAKSSSPFAPSTEAKTPFSYQTESAPTFARFEMTSQRNDVDLHRLNSTTSSSNATRMGDDGRYNNPSGHPGNPPGNVPRDTYGNPMAAPGTYEADPRMVRSHSDPRLQHQYSDRLQNQYSDGNLASRRGGYGSRGHGPPPRGPPGPPMGGGYSPRSAPRSGRARGRGAPPRGAPPMRGRTPPPGYPRPGGGYPGGYDQYGAMPAGVPHVPHGPSSGRPIGPGFEAPEPQYRDEPGLHQDPAPRPPHDNQVEPQRPSPQSSGNVHEDNEPYIPPRAEWGNLNFNGNHGGPRPGGPSSTNYYEDVDPRFAEPAPSEERLPSALVPGGGGAASGTRTRDQQPPTASGDNPEPPAVAPPDEDNSMGPDGEHNRLSNISDTSHFTSISERPINPRWQESLNRDLPPVPPPPPPVPRTQDVLLSSNPDFELPMARPGRGRGRGRGRGGRGGGRMTPVNEFDYLSPGSAGGRYPGF